MTTLVNEKEIQQEEKVEVKAPSTTPVTYFKEVREEFSKISWPSREQVTREFFSVILLVSVLTLVIFMIDKILGTTLDFFSGRLF